MAADFHKISSIGAYAAFKFNGSTRAEAAYIIGHHFKTAFERWGFQDVGGCGVCPPPSKQLESDTLEYDIGVHDRLFEDGLFAMQARQIVILDRPDTADDLKFETIFWVNLKKRLLEPED